MPRKRTRRISGRGEQTDTWKKQQRAGGQGFGARRMVHIGDLPKEILLDLLSRVPGRDLVRNCRLVCSQWRDLVDVAALWKRKAQREGYLPKKLDRSVPDWRTFYFFRTLKRKLIKIHIAEADFDHWDYNGEDRRKVRRPAATDGQAQKFFVTSDGFCTKCQFIGLKNEGYSDELMDKTKPDIVLKDWYIVQHDCGCRYELEVSLLSADYQILKEFHFADVEIEQRDNTRWHEVSHTFQNYPSGVRYVFYIHRGHGIKFFAGWCGIWITNSSITIGQGVDS